MKKLLFATRPSVLARWQTNYIIEKLHTAWEDLICGEVVITTKGDQELEKPLPEIGGKGLFTYELEQALLDGRVDAAVHSLKDLPTEVSPGLVVGVIPERHDSRDVLICHDGCTLDELPNGALVGTSSVRRQAQLLAYRPDLEVASIRGNIDTRLRKVQAGQYEAIILAAAGVLRLGMDHWVTQWLPYQLMLPAPGQGALAVQCRANDESTRNYLQALDHPPTRLAVTAERAFLNSLGGGCSLPVGAYATYERDELKLRGVVLSPDGKQIIRNEAQGDDPVVLGQRLAQMMYDRGAGSLLSVADIGNSPKEIADGHQ